MSVFTQVWFWIFVIAIIILVVAMVLVESYNVRNGTVTQTPNWVWFLFALGVIFIIWSLVLVSIKAAKEMKLKKDCEDARACGLAVCEDICPPLENKCVKFGCTEPGQLAVPCPIKDQPKPCPIMRVPACSKVIEPACPAGTYPSTVPSFSEQKTSLVQKSLIRTNPEMFGNQLETPRPMVSSPPRTSPLSGSPLSGTTGRVGPLTTTVSPGSPSSSPFSYQ